MVALNRKQWLWILGVATVLYFLAFSIPESAMKNAGGPGLLEFEMVATAERAAQFISDLGEDGVAAAKWAIWMDFPFILLFASFLSLAMRAAADRCGDVIEDIGLLAILFGSTSSWAPALATGLAVAKFILLTLVATYLIAVLAATGIRSTQST